MIHMMNNKIENFLREMDAIKEMKVLEPNI